MLAAVVGLFARRRVVVTRRERARPTLALRSVASIVQALHRLVSGLRDLATRELHLTVEGKRRRWQCRRLRVDSRQSVGLLAGGRY